jgi:hypothetical protein
MWPVAVLAAVAVAIVFAISLYNVRPETQTPVRTVTDQERFANSNAAVREQGAAFPEISPIPVTSNPGQWTYANAKAYVDSLNTYPGMARYAAYEDGLASTGGPENPSVGISQVTESSGTVVRPGFLTADTFCGQCR